MYREDILNNVSIEVLKKIQGEFGINITDVRDVKFGVGVEGAFWSETIIE